MTDFDWNTAPTICELNGYRWVLGPEAEHKMDWYAANEWCKSVGGVLPPREVLLLAYLNEDIVDSFAEEYYWSSSEGYSGNSWVQSFGSGLHGYGSKGNADFRVRAVKAIKLGE